jgi:hypothetical protein
VYNRRLAFKYTTMQQLTYKAQLSQQKQAATKTYIQGLPPPGVWLCMGFNFACLHASPSALISYCLCMHTAFSLLGITRITCACPPTHKLIMTSSDIVLQQLGSI